MVDASAKYGRYHLGSALYFLSQAVPRQGSLPDHAISVMRRLTEETGETSFLCAKTGVETTCIECVESPQAIITRYDVGKVRPLHVGAASKAILAFLPDLEIKKILRGELRKITDNTITSPSKLQKEIERIRRSGYAYSDQELIIGARAVSAPVFDSDGSISASVTISAPISRLRNSNRAKIANLVTKAGQQISRAIE
jgi:DNA-binding IclR family transcriptional regulator